MEPDVIHMYSSSPPPLDDAAEEDDDEFGDFGGFLGVASSISFTEFESPKGFSSAHPTDTLPPGHFSDMTSAGITPDFTLGGPGRGQSSNLHDPSCNHIDSEGIRMPAAQAERADVGWTEAPVHGEVMVVEVLTNGFTADEASSSSATIGPKRRGPAAKPTQDFSIPSFVTDPSQADKPHHCSQVPDTEEHEHVNGLHEGSQLAEELMELHYETRLAETCLDRNGVGDEMHSTGSVSPAVDPRGMSNGARKSYVGEESEPSDSASWTTHLNSQQGPAVAENGIEWLKERDISPCRGTGADGLMSAEERGMKNESGPGAVSASVSDDFASFCQAVSPDGLEDFGDFSTVGFDAPPPPSDHIHDDEGFGGFSQTVPETQDRFADFAAGPSREPTDKGESVGFDTPKEGENEQKEGEDSQGDFTAFPGSDSFADFSSAPVEVDPEVVGGWNAFGEPVDNGRAREHSWAAFREDPSSVHLDESAKKSWDVAVAAPPPGSPEISRRDSVSASLASRLERLFRASFPEVQVLKAGEEVLSLKDLLELPESKEEQSSPSHRELRGVWWQLQDIHDAFGLKYQWGGSHSNRTLLCSLGIDTRNILFTGQKKQPVIVPMFAASLGMLEPTKEPVKPLSATEKIASIAQTPPASSETSSSTDSTQQEMLPPVQFDWSSSGLTNPLDGVDPELYELTRAKLEISSSSAADAFARLMSTVEKTSSSTRKPRQQENLSEEASKVMAALPDLSFMQAKVLMFPTTLTPLDTSDPVPD
ncbi:hypothetical protein AGOR_G00118930 [Albula goreensis]|uniref:Aftiphilin clathrin-binding box domain-containing protein n=1 Tax=Albula goreensis TaxID=1534307 RepID=A0A8T3DH40_9TELE|nr:hypothetical protein AGOR_G00118930 [Albula goreensis]